MSSPATKAREKAARDAERERLRIVRDERAAKAAIKDEKDRLKRELTRDAHAAAAAQGISLSKLTIIAGKTVDEIIAAAQRKVKAEAGR
jgi:hypothetical protein